MQYYYQLVFTNLILLFIAFALGLYSWRLLDTATKTYCILMGLTLVEEAIAVYCTVYFDQNMPVLRVYSFVEIALLSVYYNYSIEFFKNNKIGFYIAAISLFIATVDCLNDKSFGHISTFFMCYEGTAVIAMSLFSLFQLARRDLHIPITSVPHFWIASTQIIFWAFAILSLAFHDFFKSAVPGYQLLINYSLFGINYFCYLVTAFIFFYYPKMHKAHV